MMGRRGPELTFVVALVLAWQLVMTTGALAGEPSTSTRPLVLETTVFHDEAAARAHFGRLRSYLERETGLEFKLVVAPDYLAASEDLRRGDADFALLSPALACKTRRWVPDVGYVATARISPEGSFYRSVIFTLASGPVRTLADARDTALAVVSEESSSGYLFPVDRLASLGLDPATHFRKVYFVGTHKAVVDAVSGGSASVGAAFVDALSAGGAPERFHVLERTDPIPAASLLASPFVSEERRAVVRAALLAPGYLAAVRGSDDGQADAGELAYSDFGWQVLPDTITDAPCGVAERVRAARKRREEGTR